MAYTRVNWQNSPSHATPLSAENLNVMDAGIASLDTAVTEATGDISTLETEVGEQATTISGLQTTVGEHTADIGNLETSVEDNTSDISDLKEDLDDVKGGFAVHEQLTFESATGYYNKNGAFNEYSGIKTMSLDVNPEDVWYFTSYNFWQAARVVFFDTNDSVVSVVFSGNDENLVADTRIEVPTGATRMLLQCEQNHITGVDLYRYDSKSVIDNIENEIQDIVEATTTDTTENIELTFESATGFYNKNGHFDTFNEMVVASVDVASGETYYIDTQNFWNAAIVVFLNNSNAVVDLIWLANNENTVSDYGFTIPTGATKMLIQNHLTPRTSLRKVAGIKAKPVKSILDGKSITAIGDSITEKNYRAKTNWVLWIKQWCGAVIQNLGRGGTGFRAGKDNNQNYINKIASIAGTPDIIGVACSFNDIANNAVVIGTISDTTADDSVAGYANDFFDALITAYPTTPIICYVQGPWSAFHWGQARSDQWISLLAEICATRGIPFYSDLYKGSALKPWIEANRPTYYTSDDTDGGSSGVVDDVHPNSEGHKVIARYLYPKFVENIVSVGLNYSNE